MKQAAYYTLFDVTNLLDMVDKVTCSWQLSIGFVILSILIPVVEAECKLQEICSYNLTGQKTCKRNSIITDIYDMVKSLHHKVGDKVTFQKESEKRWDNGYLSNSVPSDGSASAACLEVSDDALWEALQNRLEKRRKMVKDLQAAHKKLYSQFEEISKTNSVQLSSLQLLGSQLESCQLLEQHLNSNISDLTRNLEESKLEVKNLNLIKQNISILQEQLTKCQKKFEDVEDILAQLPELSSPRLSNYLTGSSPNDEEVIPENFIIEWKQNIREVVDKMDTQKSTIELLRAQLKAVRDDNQRLQTALSMQTNECNTRYSSCVKSVTEWKRKFDEEVRKHTDVKTGKQSDTCFNTVAANFCSLEETDLTHGETCWFERLSSADFFWRVVSNRQLIRHRRHKHITDHTCGSSQGRFFFLDLARLAVGRQAMLTSVPLYSKTKQCFSFWYKADYVFNIGRFYIFVMMDTSFSNLLQVWNQNTARRGEWQFGKFEIPAHIAEDGYKIQFVAESNGPGYVAIDDLAFTSGACIK